MSLREEIHRILLYRCHVTMLEANQYEDMIISCIENRIDERIKKMDDPEWWYNNLPKFERVGSEIFDAQMMILKEIKNILKD